MYQKILVCALVLHCAVLPASAKSEDNHLTQQDLKAVVAEASQWSGIQYRYGGKDKNGIDCSHFVYAIYNRVFEGYNYRVAGEYLNGADFSVITSEAHVGDVIVFPGGAGNSDHVGIITDVRSKKFIGAQTSTGVMETSYASGTYWGNRRYKIVTLLSPNDRQADAATPAQVSLNSPH